MQHKLITSPIQEPLTLTEVKLHLRIDSEDEDFLLASLISAAREHCENFTGRQFITATYEQYLNYFPREIVLPKSPLQTITSIKYTDENGILQTLAASYYSVIDLNPGRITLAYGQQWPSTRCDYNTVIVKYVAGYGSNPNNVPASIREAMKLLIGNWYENRESVVVGTIVTKLPDAVEALLWANRMF
jgi:uncharacterized phiE125 gp8 family phage protein